MTDVTNPWDLVLRHQTLLDLLESILKGSDTDTITIDGEVRPVIAKDIKDKYDAFKDSVATFLSENGLTFNDFMSTSNASFSDFMNSSGVSFTDFMAQANTDVSTAVAQVIADIDSKWAAVQALVDSSLVFETKAAMDAYVPTADANGFYPVAKVWNDDIEVNGAYGWSSSSLVWSKYDDDIYSRFVEITNAITSYKMLIPALALQRVDVAEYDTSEDDEFEPAIISEQTNQSLLGFDSEGKAHLDLHERSINNSYEHLNDNNKKRTSVNAGERFDINEYGNSNDEFEPAIISEQTNQSLLGFDSEGKAKIDLHESVLRTHIYEETEQYSVVGKAQDSDLVFAIVDDSDKPQILASCDNKGVWCFPANQSDYGINIHNRPIIYHLINDGQSQSIGYLSTPALTTESPEQNFLMPDGGLTDLGIPYSLVKYREINNETPVGGIASGLSNFLGDIVDFDNAKFKMAFSCPGIGGTQIYQYLAGNEYSENFSNQVQGVYDAAKKIGIDYQIHAYFTSIGGSDMSAGTLKDDFKSQTLQLLSERQSACRNIVERPNLKLKTILWQNGFRATKTDDIPMAQYELAEENETVVLACPSYMFTFADSVHLTNLSSKWLGYLFARAYKSEILHGTTWVPLKPNSIVGVSNMITVAFDIPRPPLEFDVGTLTEIENQGFLVVDDDGAPTIESVSIVGGKEINITLDRELTTNPILSYAEIYTGTGIASDGNQPRGMLRDSAGYDESFSVDGYEIPLHNWCVSFKLPIA